MKIFDCFMYFDEDLVLDLRLNLLDDQVDYFVIVESKFNHKGEKRELKFDIDKYQSFKKKILYLVYDQIPNNLDIIKEDEDKDITISKYMFNAGKRENSQRNFTISTKKYATFKWQHLPIICFCWERGFLLFSQQSRAEHSRAQ